MGIVGFRKRYVLFAFPAFLSLSLVLTRPPAISDFSWPVVAGERYRHEGVKIAVVESAGRHDDIAGGVIYGAESIAANVTVYRDNWSFGFEEVLTTMHKKPTHSTKALPQAIANKDFDVIIAVSCDPRWLPSDILQSVIDTPSVYFMCMHHEMHSFHWQNARLRPLARQGRLEFMLLAKHTWQRAQEDLKVWKSRGRGDLWRDASAAVYVTIFPHASTKADSKVIPTIEGAPPKDFAILGDLEEGRRRFRDMFSELERSIRENPKAWGYDLVQDLTGDSIAAIEPTAFNLHIFGADRGKVLIPHLLKDVVQVHSGLKYNAFYKLLSQMDYVVPAWHGDEYWYNRVSSSIYASVITQTRTIVHSAISKAYNFLDPVSYISHNRDESEVAFISKLRSGKAGHAVQENDREMWIAMTNRIQGENRQVLLQACDKAKSRQRKLDL